MKDELEKIKPMKAAFDHNYAKRLDGDNVKTVKDRWDMMEQIREDIRNFKQESGVDRVVVLWAASTEIYVPVDEEIHGSLVALEKAMKADDREQRHYDEVIYTSPDGQTLTQPMANRLSLLQNIIILCGHYKGIDYRIREHLVTMEISIGDYVLTGGELPAAVIADAVVRLIPGVIGDEQSALSDSFQDGLLAPPVYTRPAEYKGWRVPDILLSGHAAKIADWRYEQALERTRRLRPDLLGEKPE